MTGIRRVLAAVFAGLALVPARRAPGGRARPTNSS